MKKPDVVLPEKGMAVVDLRGQYLMPMTAALTLMDVLTETNRVEYDWQTKSYKFITNDSDGLGSIKLLSVTDVARIHLEQ